MGTKVTVKTSRSGINQMVRSDFMRHECERRAERVVFTGQQIAPVRTGEYRASMFVRSGTRGRGAYAQAVAGAKHSIWVEKGNSRGAPAQRVMARALLAARD